MVMSVTVNAAQKIPGRVKMVSAYSGSGLRISAWLRFMLHGTKRQIILRWIIQVKMNIAED